MLPPVILPGQELVGADSVGLSGSGERDRALAGADVMTAWPFINYIDRIT